MTVVFYDQRLIPAAETKLRERLSDQDLRVSARPMGNLYAPGTDPSAREAEVLFGQPSLDTLRLASAVRWVHLSSAGYARYDVREARALFRERGAKLTTSSQVYAVPCAEQAFAGMLALARRIDVCLAEQPHGTWLSDDHRRRAALLAESQVLLLGFGAIGRALAPRLQAFGARVVAVRRRPQRGDPVPTLTESQMHPALAEADFVVSLLPGGPQTEHFLDRDRLARMKRGAFFVNVGRGRTVEQDALREALECGRLGGAYLDVTDPEPLPPEDPLRTAPRTIISPHMAGGRPGEMLALVDHFLENFDRFRRGEDLNDRVL